MFKSTETMREWVQQSTPHHHGGITGRLGPEHQTEWCRMDLQTTEPSSTEDGVSSLLVLLLI